MNYESFFISHQLTPNSTIYKWNLNKVPNGCDQILILAKLIAACRREKKLVELRPDKRKRAKGLLVIFANNPPAPATEVAISENVPKTTI